MKDTTNIEENRKTVNPWTGGTPRIAVIGLGYVGLPLVVEFTKKGFEVLGYDINEEKVKDLKDCKDRTGEITEKELLGLNLTSNEEDLEGYNFFIVTVPTPADSISIDLSYVKGATDTVAKYLSTGSIVVYESTVYPGTTDGICAKRLEQESGLIANKDFFYGYSPERINPGDPLRKLTNIVKITSGSTLESSKFIDKVYKEIVEAGTHPASNIKTAESSKILENVQRDVNIALVNEMSSFFRAAGINVNDVIDAASTKWNFAEYRPGLVGGHCIGTDTYYYLEAARDLLVDTPVTKNARLYNEGMVEIIVKELFSKIKKADNFLIMGYTFKENCKDIRNTKVLDLFNEIHRYAITCDLEPCVKIWDPLLEKEDVKHVSSTSLFVHDPGELERYDAVIVAVAHDQFKELNQTFFDSILSEKGILVDIKGLYGFSDWKL